MALLTLVLIGSGIYFAAVFYSNRRIRPDIGPIAPSSISSHQPEAKDTLAVMTWNIGYGALGKDADLIIDQGKSLRALTAKDIASATQHIAERLAVQTSDVICLQENANAGFLTRGVPVRRIINAALSERCNLFWSDMKTALLPRFLHVDHGMSVHARVRLRDCVAVLFPQDDTSFFLGLKKHYGGMISRIRIADSIQEWVVFNIHLSAFDPDAEARLRQLQDLLRLAQYEFDQGNFVVIAGDWNMRLALTEFPHQTDAKDIFWLPDFPQSALAEGWKVAADVETPTVRSLNTKYAAGQNYTTIIDGFVCSPNVDITHIAATNLGFEFTDHHPVEACFKALS